LAVHIIRHVLAARPSVRARDGVMPRGRLRAVVEYIEGHLGANPSLEQMAAVVGLNPYHFAKRFKKAAGLPPQQYLIPRRVERDNQLVQKDSDLSLAQVVCSAGFSECLER